MVVSSENVLEHYPFVDSNRGAERWLCGRCIGAALTHTIFFSWPRQIWEALGVIKQGALKLMLPLLEVGLVLRDGTRKSGQYILA
jgi:hypothetical protein